MTKLIGVFSVKLVLPPLKLFIIVCSNCEVNYDGMDASHEIFSGNIVYTFYFNVFILLIFLIFSKSGCCDVDKFEGFGYFKLNSMMDLLKSLFNI